MDVAYKWKDIGISLGLDDGELKRTERDYDPDDVRGCLRDMLRTWLIRHSTSWSEFADALERSGHSSLASKVKDKYLLIVHVYTPIKCTLSVVTIQLFYNS